MKIKKRTLLWIDMAMFLSVSVYFFRVRNSLFLLFILSSTLLAIVLFPKKLRRMSSRYPFVCFLVAYTTVMVAVLFSYTSIFFPKQPIGQSVQRAWPYLTIYMVIVALLLLECYGDIKILIGLVDLIASAWLAAVVAQHILYGLDRRIFLTSYLQGSDMVMRHGNIRIELTFGGNLMILYHFYQAYKGRGLSKVFHGAWTALGLYGLIAIQQTRMYTLIVLVCLGIIVFRIEEDRRIRRVILVAVAVAVVYQTGIIGLFFSSFRVSGALGGSTLARLYAIKYYLGYVREHPLAGMAFADAQSYPSVVRGPVGWAYMSDVGIVGQLATLGGFVVPYYVVPLIRFFLLTWSLSKNGTKEEGILATVMYAFLFLTSGTLIILDPYRCYFYPCFIAAFEYMAQGIEKERPVGYGEKSLWRQICWRKKT